MELSNPLVPKPQPVTWYRQRSLQLIVATLVFLSPLLALPLVWSQTPVSQPLALRDQPVKRLQVLASGAVTLFYAQTSGNLWRSVDEGITWTRADRGLPASRLGASAVIDWVVAPADPWTLYAVVWYGDEARLFQSSDGGDTWRVGGRLEDTAAAPDSPQTYTVASAAANLRHVYLANNAWLWSSHDSGQSWRQAGALPTHAPGKNRPLLAVDSGDPDLIFASLGTGIWRSRDQGQSWQPAGDLSPLALVGSLATAQERSGLVFAGGQAAVMHSADGGDRWTTTKLPGAQGLIRSLLVDPRVGETLFAMDEQSRIFRSDDAGHSWHAMPSGSSKLLTALALNPVRRDRLYSAGNDGIWAQPVELLLPTATPRATASSTPTVTPSPTATTSATATPTPSAAATPTPPGTPTNPTPQVTAAATVAPSARPPSTPTTGAGAGAPSPTVASPPPQSTASPTGTPASPLPPTVVPTSAPTATPPPPTAVPTSAPTATPPPTAVPTLPPTPPPR